MLKADFKPNQIKRIRSILDVKKVARASRNAINTTATATRKLSLVEGEKEYNIKQARLKKDSQGKPTTFIIRASRTRDHATITYKAVKRDSDRPGLQHYRVDRGQTNKKKPGSNPRVRIRRSGGTEIVPRAFYGVGKLKGQGIFQRKLTGKKIVRRSGPSIRNIIEDTKVSAVVSRKSIILLRDNFRIKLRDQWKIR